MVLKTSIAWGVNECIFLIITNSFRSRKEHMNVKGVFCCREMHEVRVRFAPVWLVHVGTVVCCHCERL